MFLRSPANQQTSHQPCARCGAPSAPLAQVWGHHACAACIACWHQGLPKMPPAPLPQQPWRPDGLPPDEYAKALDDLLAAERAAIAHWTAEWLKAGKERAA